MDVSSLLQVNTQSIVKHIIELNNEFDSVSEPSMYDSSSLIEQMETSSRISADKQKQIKKLIGYFKRLIDVKDGPDHAAIVAKFDESSEFWLTLTSCLTKTKLQWRIF